MCPSPQPSPRKAAGGGGHRASRSLQLISHLVDCGLGADFILFAARRTGNADRTDHLFADLDRQRASDRDNAGEELRAAIGIFGEVLRPIAGGRAEGTRGIGLALAVLDGMWRGIVA